MDKVWADEFRNSLQITNDKKIKIVYNDIQIDPKFIPSTDMFCNVDLTDLSRISKSAYLSIIPDDVEINNYIYVISFLGKDNYLRTRIFIDNKWITISSLYLGYKLINAILSNLTTNYFKELNPKKVSAKIPLDVGRQWITSWPPHRHAVSVIDKENPFLLQQLGLQKEIIK